MEHLIVHPRVFAKHPQLSEDDVRTAWENSFYEAIRPDSSNFPEYLWIGEDAQGRTVEMVGTPTENGWLIYHANTPLSGRVLSEMKRNRRR